MENFVGSEHNAVVEVLATIGMLEPDQQHSRDRAEAALECATRVRDAVLNAKNACPTAETIKKYEEIQFIYNCITRVMEAKFSQQN